MDHRLFVTRQIVSKRRVLLEGLTDSRDVAMPEDPPHAGEKRSLLPISLHVLLREKAG